MIKLNFLFFILFSLHSLVLAQNPTNNYFLNEVGMYSTPDSKISINANGDTVMVMNFSGGAHPNTQVRNELSKVFMGTPYFKHRWDKGTITMPNESPEEVFMAYNVEKDLVYVSFPKVPEAIALRPKEFSFLGSNFKNYFKEYKNAGIGFYEILVAGEKPLLKKHKCIVVADKIEGYTGYEVNSSKKLDGEFVKQFSYYTITNDKVSLIKSTRNLQRFLEDSSIEIPIIESELIPLFQKINQK